MENTHNFYLPTANLMGVGCIKDLPTEMLARKYRKALVITDTNMVELGILDRVETILKTLKIIYNVYDGINSTNPTVTHVEEALTYTDTITLLNYDVIISVGGGTSHDCAKAVSAVATHGGSIIDYEGYNKLSKPAIPLIAVNTTTGSGAELTMFSIITDESRKIKMTISDPRLMSTVSVNDPLMMYSMPKHIASSSGIDAIVQAIESYVSIETSPITEVLSLKSVELGFKYLRRICENTNDMEAVEQMVFCASSSGMAFNNAGLGYVHAISHQIGGFYNTIHGFSNAILLPHVLEFNAKSVPEERLITLAKAIGIKTNSSSDALTKIIDEFYNLCKDVGLPTHLKELSVLQEDLDALANNAKKDICTLTNPRRGTVDDIKQILINAM